MQLFFSIPMLGFGHYFEDMETCSIDRDVSEVLVVMGFVMSLIAMNYIILGILTQFKIKDCVDSLTKD